MRLAPPLVIAEGGRMTLHWVAELIAFSSWSIRTCEAFSMERIGVSALQ
jgi:hypothetical protein